MTFHAKKPYFTTNRKNKRKSYQTKLLNDFLFFVSKLTFLFFTLGFPFYWNEMKKFLIHKSILKKISFSC